MFLLVNWNTYSGLRNRKNQLIRLFFYFISQCNRTFMSKFRCITQQVIKNMYLNVSLSWITLARERDWAYLSVVLLQKGWEVF